VCGCGIEHGAALSALTVALMLSKLYWHRFLDWWR
jgi:hypothetical protein